MHTNSTPNLELSQFISTDKPTWLGDVNGDMLKIDTAYAAVGAVASGASSKADTAISTAEAASTTATDAATLANTANTNANSALTTAGNAATAAQAAGELAQTAKSAADAADDKADANTTNIGDLTALTTTAKTSLVAAINEVDAKPAGATDADDVTYDNTTSGLSATNVQDALDELAQASPVGEKVSVTCDGVKTISAMLDDLYALVDFSKVTASTTLTLKGTVTIVLHMHEFVAGRLEFGATWLSQSHDFRHLTINIKAAGSDMYQLAGSVTGATNLAGATSTNGDIFSVIY